MLLKFLRKKRLSICMPTPKKKKMSGSAPSEGIVHTLIMYYVCMYACMYVCMYKTLMHTYVPFLLDPLCSHQKLSSRKSITATILKEKTID